MNSLLSLHAHERGCKRADVSVCAGTRVIGTARYHASPRVLCVHVRSSVRLRHCELRRLLGNSVSMNYTIENPKLLPELYHFI